MDYGRWLRAMAAQHALEVEQVRAGYLAGKVKGSAIGSETWDAITAHDTLVGDDDGGPQ